MIVSGDSISSDRLRHTDNSAKKYIKVIRNNDIVMEEAAMPAALI